MLNKHNEKILNYIFVDDEYTEEQKAVMISSLSNSVPESGLINGRLNPDHRRFFIDALSKAGFFLMDTFLQIAQKASDSSEYLISILGSLDDNQKEKYAMLFLLFASDCRSRKEDTSYTDKYMVSVLEAIGLEAALQKEIATKMIRLL